MSRVSGIAAFASRQWAARSVPWIGTVLIAAVAILAATDIVRGYRVSVAETGRELETQARIIAEQTARSVQAIDVVLRHVSEQFQKGGLSRSSDQELHNYLREQAVGLVQADGLAMHNADGSVRAISWLYPAPDTTANVAALPAFQKVRDDPKIELLIGEAIVSRVDGQWFFPIGRRLLSQTGNFAGTIAARGRIDYFQQFYQDVQLDKATKVTLMHRQGTLLARYPPVDSALGKHFPPLDQLLAARAAGDSSPLRMVSPVDGVERFVALKEVPEYSMIVLVSRDTAVALAPWREQALGTGARTLALGALAAVLLALLTRQLSRLRATGASLEASKERFAAAVAGSDDGIWDWDMQTRRVFASARAREILGFTPGPEKNDAAEWFAGLRIHPDDQALRVESMHAHLEGRSPAYAIEYRVQRQDGSWHWVRARGLCVRGPDGKPLRLAGSVSDIDAQRRAEDALRESEERYVIATTGSKEGHWVWNLATDELFVSPMMREIFELQPDAQFITRARFGELINIHPDDLGVLQKGVDDHIAGATAQFEIEYRLILRNGAIRWIHSRGQCFRDAGGKAVRMAGATNDVSERKRAEDALRQSEKRFALAVAGSNDGIVDWDVVNDRMYSSPRAMRIMGIESNVTMRSRAEWRDLVKYHPDDVQRVRDDLQNFLDGHVELREGEYRVLLPNGECRWIRHRNKCVRDAAGHPIRVAGSISDVDAQKRAEEGLRESQERYQLAVAGSNEGMWDWDMRSETFFFSARAQELLGLDPGEPMRPCCEWWPLFGYHPDDEKRVKDALAAYLGGAGKYWEVEYRLRHRRTGDWHWYRERGVALRDDKGQPYRMAGSMEDISDRKRAELQRDRLEGQLRQAQKLEAIGTLAGGIAHDFNNVLSAILGYGEMAQKDAREGTPLRRNIDAAISAGMRAKSLVERILAFSRSSIGERVPVHVESIVAETLDAIADSVPHGVLIERNLAAGDSAVMGDAAQIHQVVLNLCTNAMQAMRSEGTLTVALQTIELVESRTLSTGTITIGNYVQLSVRDTGHGIAAHVLERMFDPFFTTKGVGVGTGLGLSLVHGIVTDLGGGIDVQSAPGAGATFTVYLPRQGRVAAPALAVETIASGSGETILLVDDELALVKVGEEMLAMLGYEPVGFASSTAALETFRASPQRFDAVLSDEAMPEMTGSELAKEIRKLHPDIPIVLMSGYVTPALHARAHDAGVVEVLAKPLVSRDIARSLAGVLRS
ncbi:MAG: PAS domain-containing protein [Pseudomonadota bacterium]|nr:PAS domain-containing protein [Burkholderiaceae bacterium]MDQ3446234.1 PAS domain-containing protein [Pseudomonadota bacterium]